MLIWLSEATKDGSISSEDGASSSDPHTLTQTSWTPAEAGHGLEFQGEECWKNGWLITQPYACVPAAARCHLAATGPISAPSSRRMKLNVEPGKAQMAADVKPAADFVRQGRRSVSEWQT